MESGGKKGAINYITDVFGRRISFTRIFLAQNRLHQSIKPQNTRTEEFQLAEKSVYLAALPEKKKKKPALIACKQSNRHQYMFLEAAGFIPATTTVCDIEEVQYKYRI